MKYYYRYPGVQSWTEIDKQTFYNIRRRKGSICDCEYYKGVLVARYVEVIQSLHAKSFNHV